MEGKIANIHLCFANFAIFQTIGPLWCYNYVTQWPVIMILVCMDRRDANLYYGSKQHHFIGMGADIKITGGGNHLFWTQCYKKRAQVADSKIFEINKGQIPFTNARNLKLHKAEHSNPVETPLWRCHILDAWFLNYICFSMKFWPTLLNKWIFFSSIFTVCRVIVFWFLH